MAPGFLDAMIANFSSKEVKVSRRKFTDAFKRDAVSSGLSRL
jgi:hypothetical protein